MNRHFALLLLAVSPSFGGSQESLHHESQHFPLECRVTAGKVSSGFCPSIPLGDVKQWPSGTRISGRNVRIPESSELNPLDPRDLDVYNVDILADYSVLRTGSSSRSRETCWRCLWTFHSPQRSNRSESRCRRWRGIRDTRPARTKRADLSTPQ